MHASIFFFQLHVKLFCFELSLAVLIEWVWIKSRARWRALQLM